LDVYLNIDPRKGVRREGPAMTPPKGRKALKRSRSTVAKDSVDAKSRIAELPRFEISGLSLRILLGDAILPRHTTAPRGGRPRMTYVPGEIVHFELGGHRYALVSELSPSVFASNGEDAATPPDVPADVSALLTNRELQIVQLICMGYYTKQVAGRLKLSEFTVKSYLKTVYCKLRVRSRGAMVYRYAQTFLCASDQSQHSQ